MAELFAVAVCLLTWLSPASAQPADSVLVEDYAVGSFQRATRIELGTQGSIFVLDADENKLSLFSNLQDAPKTLGGFGWSSSSFDTPTGVATDGVNVYVSDFGNHRIQRFDRDFNYISSLSTRDTSDVVSRFGYPLDIALSELGDLFILDGENIRVMKFNAQNSFERAIGDMNAGKGKLQNPLRLVATNSRIFVGEKNKVLVYDYFGNYLGSVGEGIIHSLSGFTMLTNGILAASNDTIWWFTREGALQNISSLDNIISGERIDQIQDIASNGKQLFILSLHRIHVFRMSY
ncbi:MAG: NHL repeat-containing protein [Ignavibacteriales bacterium]|nr:NHL repeat-containing protein [Ignavibacteriales bacterium]